MKVFIAYRSTRRFCPWWKTARLAFCSSCLAATSRRWTLRLRGFTSPWLKVGSGSPIFLFSYVSLRFFQKNLREATYQRSYFQRLIEFGHELSDIQEPYFQRIYEWWVHSNQPRRMSPISTNFINFMWLWGKKRLIRTIYNMILSEKQKVFHAEKNMFHTQVSSSSSLLFAVSCPLDLLQLHHTSDVWWDLLRFQRLDKPVGSTPGFNISCFFLSPTRNPPTKWAPTSLNPYTCPYKWVTGDNKPWSGVITLPITGRGPLCNNDFKTCFELLSEMLTDIQL